MDVYLSFSLIFCILFTVSVFYTGFSDISVPRQQFNKYEDIMFANVMKELLLAIPTTQIVLVIDYNVDEDFQTLLMRTFNNGTGIMLAVYRIVHVPDGLIQLYADINSNLESYTSSIYFMITDTALSEDILEMIRYEDLIRRNLLYMFYWKDGFPSVSFQHNIIEAMRVCVIISRDIKSYQVYYSQSKSSGTSQLLKVNWFSSKHGGLYKHPLLPPAEEVYQDFNGRTFYIPVLHKPPWHFVVYDNNTIVVEGGRDDKLLKMLAEKLNFQFEYFDPPERSQGSVIMNASMNGVLGQIWRRDVDLFIGDITVTYNRSQAVEFSFLTLADNEAFLTHVPGRLNEAYALVRSFHWEVWPLVIFTILVSGPLLFLIIYVPCLWNQEEKKTSSPLVLFYECNWFIYGIFLRQGVSLQNKKQKVRFVVIVLSLSATYVIGDMYSANLTSMLARPATEIPITNLEQLANAMETKGYQLLVEKFSSSHGNVENGTGLYSRIWQRMQKQKMYPLIESTEAGVKLVRDKRNVALIGGRETFFFDTRRFGAQHFHLSEKLYTRYSAIAMQLGCPYIYRFNQILMRLFEAGILNKITEDEYEKLGEKKRLETKKNNEEIEDVTSSVTEGNDKEEQDDKLRPMSIKALRGGFIIIIIGNCSAGVILLGEIIYNYFNRH